jgi:ABC-type lipoprotein release transport system permease subunit
MAEREGGGSSPWVAFLAGIILVAIVAIGIVAYSGGFNRQQETAQLEMNVPDVKVNPPDINLPEPPSVPTTPPSADQAPVEAPATP